VAFAKGDLIPTQQKGIKYLLETLEPEAMDLFQLNFFDTMLQQKKASDYVFEDSATTILKENPKLKPNLSQK
jgi:hypothetical protein